VGHFFRCCKFRYSRNCEWRHPAERLRRTQPVAPRTLVHLIPERGAA
jgi:hypothetical protein